MLEEHRGNSESPSLTVISEESIRFYTSVMSSVLYRNVCGSPHRKQGRFARHLSVDATLVIIRFGIYIVIGEKLDTESSFAA